VLLMTDTLEARRTEAQLHALADVQREIRANDGNHRRKYLQDFTQAFRSYQSVIDPGDLDKVVSQADVVLVGDYHALPSAQRFAATLLESRVHRGDRPVVLGVETIFSRDQHIIGEWWRREIGEGELRRRIRFDLDWGYDWAPFYELLATAREHAEAIYALDCMPREDLRKIAARDRHAAHKIGEIRQQHPNAAILVLFGESHLAPSHLPRSLRAQLPEERLLSVLQNVDALYWQAIKEERDYVAAVRVADDVVCVFNSTPLEKYENYRLHLSRWRRGEEHGPDVAPTIYNLIDSLIRFLNINRYCSHNGTQPRFLVDCLPEVYSAESEAGLRRMLLRTGLTESDTDSAFGRVEEQGCAYFPQINSFYVRNFQMAYAAEEAARFLHHACRGLPQQRSTAKDVGFYACVVEHTLAHFGSRVLCPNREAVNAGDNRQHFEASAELLGEMLGDRLYNEYLAGRKSRPELRRLFLASLGEGGQAKQVYQQLARKAAFARKARGINAGRQ
jgi:Haem-binding uptake, Tiki superfamily, ChaN